MFLAIRRLPAALLWLALSSGCSDNGPGAPPFKQNCTPTSPSPEAQLPAGKRPDGSAILPGGRRVSPLGLQVATGGFPLSARVLPGGRHAIVSDGGYGTNTLTLVELATGSITYSEQFEGERALFFGLAARSDGRVFVSGGGDDEIYVYQYDAAAGTLTSPRAPVHLSGPNPAGRNLIAGLALSGDERTLYAVAQVSAALIALDAETLVERGNWLLGADHPHDIALAPLASGRNEAYVTAWGGNQLMIVDLAAPFGAGAVLARIDTGKSPGSVLLMPPRGERALVANTDSDSITVVDLPSRTVERTLDVARAGAPALGSAPSHLAIAADGSRVYVTDAGENAVDVLDGSNLSRIGRFPTGWWPTGVALGPGDELVVTNGKGLGAGPIQDVGSDFVPGTVSILPVPSDAELVALTQTTTDNVTRPRRYAVTPTCPTQSPMNVLPLSKGDPTPIEHVFVILRENKTYDVELGDLEGANGDPTLTLFGEHFTPNLHALARGFSNLDNFYSNAEASIQGHQWSASATTTDFTEKAWLTTWGRGTRSNALFVSAISAPAQGYLWQQLERQNVSYANFGEAVGILVGAPKEGQDRFDARFPGVVFDLSVHDVDKARYVAGLLTDKTWPRLTFVLLPNNHTEGTTPGKPTPGSMVADNDEATGLLVEAISKSKFWPTSAIFIFEDDPQDGADHVEGHRSAGVVVSPWVKRGYTSHVHYDVPAMWVTIERLLGLDPLSLYTRDAAPMYDIFTDRPDLTPYSHRPSQVPETLNPISAPLSSLSRKLDFSKPDNAPGLGRILWRAMKGEEPPWHLRARLGFPSGADEDDDDGDRDDDDDDDDDEVPGLIDADDLAEGEGGMSASEAWKELVLPRYHGEGPPP